MLRLGVVNSPWEHTRGPSPTPPRLRNRLPPAAMNRAANEALRVCEILADEI